MEGFVVHFRDLNFALCEIPLEDFLNRRVMGCFNRIPLAAVLRTNHRRASRKTGGKHSSLGERGWCLDQDGSSDMVGSGQILDVFDDKTEWIYE